MEQKRIRTFLKRNARGTRWCSIGLVLALTGLSWRTDKKWRSNHEFGNGYSWEIIRLGFDIYLGMQGRLVAAKHLSGWKHLAKQPKRR